MPGKIQSLSHDQITAYSSEVEQANRILAPFSDGTTPRLQIHFYSP